jgi:transposase
VQRARGIGRIAHRGRASNSKRLKVQRELDRLELLRRQIADVEAERDALLHAEEAPTGYLGAQLLRLRGIGPEFATVLWHEGLHRCFANRGSWRLTPGWRQVPGEAAT